ncbi:MAG: hypothetical protein QOI74_1289 [Micromonosporaceae bacterium]|nr:hypothetical protein [Micromonosporaceae bacterium]
MRRLAMGLSVLVVAVPLTAGCGGSSGPPRAAVADNGALPSAASMDARTRLAGLAATAQDHHFRAGYRFTQSGRPARTVLVVLAANGTWRIDVPGGALGGQADVAVAGTAKGLYQCTLRIPHPGCVKVADADGSFPAAIDPRVEHPFVDWLGLLTDRRAALSVAAAPLLAGARGSCFSLETNSAALAAPVDPGIYCYDADGTLTGVRTAVGTLVLATAVTAAPPTISLPGPITAGAPLSTAAPPTPLPSERPSEDSAQRPSGGNG